jgi:hypothetical protein
MNIQQYPLQWPLGWSRKERPQMSRFQTSLGDASAALVRELRLMGAQQVIISSNLMVRQDGLPYAKQRRPDDAGVAVYFIKDGNQMCIPCDWWTDVEDNVQAIRLTVEALRGIERWGTKEMMNAAFTGFKALPAAAQEAIIVEAWWQILDVDQNCTYAEARRAYKDKALKTHPDRPGGSPEAFQRVESAWQEAIKATSERHKS